MWDTEREGRWGKRESWCLEIIDLNMVRVSTSHHLSGNHFYWLLLFLSFSWGSEETMLACRHDNWQFYNFLQISPVCQADSRDRDKQIVAMEWVEERKKAGIEPCIVLGADMIPDTRWPAGAAADLSRAGRADTIPAPSHSTLQYDYQCPRWDN